MDFNCSFDELNSILDRNSAWIENCDTKASIILGCIGVIASVFLASDYVATFYDIISAILGRTYISLGLFIFLTITMISLLGIILGCIFLVDVLIPKTNIKDFENRGVSPNSVIFYSSIAKIPSLTKYKNIIAKSSNDDLANEIISQIYVCSIICDQKFCSYKKGLKTCLISFFVFIIMMIIGYHIA